MTIKFVT